MSIKNTKTTKEKTPNKTLYFNIVHKNGLVDTFFMKEKQARKIYGDFTVDENDCVIINE